MRGGRRVPHGHCGITAVGLPDGLNGSVAGLEVACTSQMMASLQTIWVLLFTDHLDILMR